MARSQSVVQWISTYICTSAVSATRLENLTQETLAGIIRSVSLLTGMKHSMASRDTRAVLSPGNRAKPCKFRYVKQVGGALWSNGPQIQNCAKFLYFPPRTPLGEFTATIQVPGVSPRQIPVYTYDITDSGKKSFAYCRS